MDSAFKFSHSPVMLHACVEALVHNPSGTYVDATYGGGGHSAAILAELAAEARLLALDADPSARPNAACGADERFSLHHANFRDLDAVLEQEGVAALDGVLLDLGLSSLQLDDPARGFSFMRAGPLDMRLDPSSGRPLQQLLARVSERELARLIREYGEERHARSIARRLIAMRDAGELRDTKDLARACGGGRSGGIHPATRLFMALRIWVNDELRNLEEALRKIASLLVQGGRLVAISFHSLEDRIVKRFIGPRSNNDGPLRRLDKARRPDAAELRSNRRARSAMLRVACKA